MISTKLYLDCRNIKGDNDKKAPIKLVITRRRTSALISTGIYVKPDQWDAKKLVVINHPNEKRLNLHLSKFVIRIDNILIEMEEKGLSAGMTGQNIKEYVMSLISADDTTDDKGLFIPYLETFIEKKDKQRTKDIYIQTLKRIKEFSPKYNELTFDDIDKEWLDKFNRFLSKTSPSVNARNIHFRNIRAVFNRAIEDEITTLYPFRKFKIKNEATVKRALTLQQLRDFFNCETWYTYKEYQDIFKLIFYLCGINLIDLFNLTDKNVINGRIEYKRSKTGKRYSVKIEPEAAEIINRYKGKSYLINIHDRYKSHKDYMQHLNKGLSKIGPITDKSRNGVPVMQPICKELSTYWARHSWATIAAELDIPKETIAAGLGHNIGSPITSIYIDFNIKKVDEASRKIIDYVLYNKV